MLQKIYAHNEYWSSKYHILNIMMIDIKSTSTAQLEKHFS